MKREIKFRAKRIDNGKWVYGFFILEDCNGGSYIHWTDADKTKRAALVAADTVWQFTGLKDKNGKDGYHKDIVSAGKKLYIIEWQNEEARFLLLPTGNNTGTWKFMDELTHMVIIGNAYETPHLLNSEQGAPVSDTTDAK
jgi:hypothetical protein